MYNNIGLLSVRGSATSGYIQSNRSYIPPSKAFHTRNLNIHDRENVLSIRAKQDQNVDIKQHERKRLLESKRVEVKERITKQRLKGRNNDEKNLKRLLDKEIKHIYDSSREEVLNRREPCTEKNSCRKYKNFNTYYNCEKNNRPHYLPYNSHNMEYINQSISEEYHPCRCKNKGFHVDFKRKNIENLRNALDIKKNYVEGMAFIRKEDKKRSKKTIYVQNILEMKEKKKQICEQKKRGKWRTKSQPSSSSISSCTNNLLSETRRTNSRSYSSDDSSSKSYSSYSSGILSPSERKVGKQKLESS